MSRSFGMKCAALILTAVCLVGALASGLGVIYLGEQGLYYQTPEEQNTQILSGVAWSVAEYAATHYCVEQYSPADSQWLAGEAWMYDSNYYSSSSLLEQGKAFYTISNAVGVPLKNTYDPQTAGSDMVVFDYSINGTHPVALIADSKEDLALRRALGLLEYDEDSGSEWEAGPDITQPAVSSPQVETNPSGDETQPSGQLPLQVDTDAYLQDIYCTVNGSSYHVFCFQGPEYRVTVYMARDALNDWLIYPRAEINELLYPFRYTLLLGLIGCAVLSLAGIVYLCWAAGRKRGTEEIRASGLSRLPLDLYAASAVFIGFWTVMLAIWLVECSVSGSVINYGVVAVVGVLAVLVTGLALMWIYALAAQAKMKRGFWWKNSIIGRCLRWIGKYIRLAIHAVARLFGLLPLIWQWLVTAGVLVFFLVITVADARYGSTLPVLMCISVTGAVVCYVAYAFGVLAEGSKRMAKGDLSRKISTKYLVGAFRTSAKNLNALADVAVVAAENQFKSERMKTELITNVSHDIKTPLTSIINFVDLLQKPHTEQEEQEYLAVLDRQSQRLKKLIEDLMELSKATTGNLHVNITAVDACEAVNQALGEFADKLDAARLTPVVRLPEGVTPMRADGRLVWRVLSNLLSNVVKYALPGTRVYVDVVKLDGKVLISVKNISREPLNVSAEELLERFVRGDASRNTEGSGLGLNIAKSLMDVQHGLLQLLVDGDLFKVTLIFPEA